MDTHRSIRQRAELLFALAAALFAAFVIAGRKMQMLQYTAAQTGPHLALLVHHDDAVLAFAYDRQSKVGELDRAWDEALAKGWIVVSMKDDWNVIYPPRAGQ
ncbi:hypothetical protein AWB75_00886 [Caballeronia catudaia]|uniref:Uncharacterized protein n=1 Tax=Caballeronia catudaia TaxID=1777136 RepID=A0A157ZKU2_9BURK|nr:hypothetical protein AWB75_00886 [Caballeronia catudaia]